MASIIAAICEQSSTENRRPVRVLDIGCGGGFGGQDKYLARFARLGLELIGVEPDPLVQVPRSFSTVLRCPFEQAPLEPQCIDIAYCRFVLEHIRDPGAFASKLRDILVPGGWFVAFTVNASHPFCWASAAAEGLGIRNWWLKSVLGKAVPGWGDGPVYYRMNRCDRLRSLFRDWATCHVRSVSVPRQLASYFPRRVRGLAVQAAWLLDSLGGAGSVLVVLARKKAGLSGVDIVQGRKADHASEPCSA